MFLASQCGRSSNNGRIVGGVDSKVGAWPWQVTSCNHHLKMIERFYAQGRCYLFRHTSLLEKASAVGVSFLKNGWSQQLTAFSKLSVSSLKIAAMLFAMQRRSMLCDL